MTVDDWANQDAPPDGSVTAGEVLDKAASLLAELDQLQAECDALTPAERAALPDRARRFFGG